jgi:hypothetical protein
MDAAFCHRTRAMAVDDVGGNPDGFERSDDVVG